jgi:hypothetical protein
MYLPRRSLSGGTHLQRTDWRPARRSRPRPRPRRPRRTRTASACPRTPPHAPCAGARGAGALREQHEWARGPARPYACFRRLLLRALLNAGPLSSPFPNGAAAVAQRAGGLASTPPRWRCRATSSATPASLAGWRSGAAAPSHASPQRSTTCGACLRRCEARLSRKIAEPWSRIGVRGRRPLWRLQERRMSCNKRSGRQPHWRSAFRMNLQQRIGRIVRGPASLMTIGQASTACTKSCLR